MSTVNDKTTRIVLAANIQKLMAARDWSVRELSRQTTDPVMTIHNTISGKSLPRAGVLTRIADAFGVTVDQLLAR